jgi:hypothetical protein
MNDFFVIERSLTGSWLERDYVVCDQNICGR